MSEIKVQELSFFFFFLLLLFLKKYNIHSSNEQSYNETLKGMDSSIINP
jgi:hypothetical protein